MKDSGLSFLVGVLLGLLVALFVAITADDYKKGQIDALTGKVKYHLVIQPDSTRTWEEIE